MSGSGCVLHASAHKIVKFRAGLDVSPGVACAMEVMLGSSDRLTAARGYTPTERERIGCQDKSCKGLTGISVHTLIEHDLRIVVPHLGRTCTVCLHRNVLFGLVG